MSVLLGPVPCKRCRTPVVWDGVWWIDARDRHICRRNVDQAIDGPTGGGRRVTSLKSKEPRL